MKKVVIIPVNGEPYVQDLPHNAVDYETIKSNVQGWIEHVRLTTDLDMWINEEGKLIPLEINPLATLLWEKYYGQTDVIVGNAVLTAGVDEHGETQGFDENDAFSLTAMLSTLSKE